MTKNLRNIATNLSILAMAIMPSVILAAPAPTPTPDSTPTPDAALNPQNDPYRTYQQFQQGYSSSAFKQSFDKVTSYAWQGAAFLIAFDIIFAVVAVIVTGTKLGVSTNGQSRSEAQIALLKQFAVFGMIGLTPLIFFLLGTLMLGKPS